VAAADARFVFKKLYFALGQVGMSWTDVNGHVRAAETWQAVIDRTARVWGFHYEISGIADGFEADSGFVPRNNIVSANAFNRFSYYGRRGALIETITTFVGPTRVWRYADFLKEHAIEGAELINTTFTLRGGWSVGLSPARNFVYFGDVTKVSNFNNTFSVTTPVFEHFNAKIEVRTGGTAIFAEAAEGRETRVTTTLGLRPTQSARIEASLVTSRIHRKADDTEFARSTIPRLKAEYQPRRSLFVRVIAEYRSERRTLESFKGLRTDWLASFEPTPGTVVFLGYGASQERSPDRFGTDTLQRTADGFFVKLAYLIRR
jgi:hypothetical protein